MVTVYPETLAELTVSRNPTPIDVFAEATRLAGGLRGHEALHTVFAAALKQAEEPGALLYASEECPQCGDGCGGHGSAWVDDYGCSKRIDECPCLLGAVLGTALAFVRAETDAAQGRAPQDGGIVCGFELEDGSVAFYSVGGDR